MTTLIFNFLPGSRDVLFQKIEEDSRLTQYQIGRVKVFANFMLDTVQQQSRLDPDQSIKLTVSVLANEEEPVFSWTI